MSHLIWPDCLNVRDLGGLPTNDGPPIRNGALIRSDNLDRLTSDGVAAVRAAGVSRIVDVRSAWECERYPSPFSADPVWRNAPLSDPDSAGDPELDLTTQYTMLLDQNPGRIAAAVAQIADAPVGCVLVHCHAGKDRTGIVVALALSLAGVPPDVIAADYATIGDSTIDVRALVAADPAEADALPELRAPRPETMLATLTHLADRYGDVEAYLASGGLSRARARTVRARLTDSTER